MLSRALCRRSILSSNPRAALIATRSSAMRRSIPRTMRCTLLVPILVMLGTLAASAESNSPTLAAKDVLGHYALIKSLVEPHRDLYAADIQPGNKSRKYNLSDCGSIALNFGLNASTDVTTVTLTQIAAHYYMWMTELPLAGYPRASVEPLIRDYENTLLGVAHRKGANNLDYDFIYREGEKLAKKLNELRSRQRLKAMHVEYMDECGGAGTMIKFIIPHDAHMFMASTFFIELCRKQGFDPSDRTKCDRYVEVPDGTEDRYAGLFVYVGEWADGYRRAGQIDAARVGAEGHGRVFRLTR
jgi:hypothetical protein